MKRLHPVYLTLRHETRRCIGNAGALGLALLALALFTFLSLARGWRDDASDLNFESRRLMREFERNQMALRRAPKLDEQIKNFTAWFPDMSGNAADLRLIVEQAGKAALELDKGEYQVSTAAGSSFVNYEVVLPVKANYAGIRSFIAGVLNAVPHASLAELRMERPSANSDVLDARVHFTLVYRGA
jgi:hypothetical protein